MLLHTKTLRTSTALSCILFHANNAVKQEECLQKKFPEEKNTDNKLAYQTRVYFHIWGYRENEITNATSFLVMLRNPVDRVMSSYKYSHPENCNDNTRMHLPWGCEVAKDKKWNQTETHPAYELYRKCFPYASRLEDFAQATMSPWNPIKHFMETNMTMKDRWNCRKVARSALQGHTKGNTHPHMRYNYEYYARKSIWKFPGKEVFGIRTEHEWNDMVQLDKLLGGTGNFTNEAKSVSHGSEKYIPAPVSESAYHKLCCVLEREIEIYMDLLDSVENLSKQQKQESIDSVREKCGIADLSWTHWRMQCRSTIEADTLTLEKNLQG